MKFPRPTVLATAAATVALIPSAALADHSWSGYHWETSSNPVSLEIVDNVSGKWDPILNAAIADWNQSPVLTLAKSTGSGSKKDCKADPGTIKVCNAAYGYTGWLGIATIWIRGGHITRSATKLNDSYFNVVDYDTPEWRRLVTCQEIGHGFGLAHQDEDFKNPNLGTCMDYTSEPESNQQPNAHDYQMLEETYAHSHEAGMGSSSTPGKGNGTNGFSEGNDEVGHLPNGWGRPISYTADGRPDVYERQLGGGRRVLTHVFWLPETGNSGDDH